MSDDRFAPHRSGVSEPLPSGFEPELARIDDGLSRLARADRARVPAGLTDRVHAASRAHLPNAGRRRLAGSGAPPARRTAVPAAGADRHRVARWTGRLALAACLGILCVAGWWTAKPAITPGGPEGIARATDPLAENDLHAVLVNDVPWHVADEVEALDRQVASLLETGGLRSIDDVRGEIDALFPDWSTASVRAD